MPSTTLLASASARPRSRRSESRRHWLRSIFTEARGLNLVPHGYAPADVVAPLRAICAGPVHRSAATTCEAQGDWTGAFDSALFAELDQPIVIQLRQLETPKSFIE